MIFDNKQKNTCTQALHLYCFEIHTINEMGCREIETATFMLDIKYNTVSSEKKYYDYLWGKYPNAVRIVRICL